LEQHNDANRKEGWRLTHGGGSFPLIKWDEAKIILSIESDFLSTEGHEIENIRKFVKKRDIANIKDFNRFYAAESRLSATGMNADYRFAVRPEAQYDFVMSILSELINNRGMLGVSLDQNLIKGISQYSLDKLAGEHKLSIEKLRLLVSDLANNRGSSITYAGDMAPVDVHAAVNILNEVLENGRMYRTDAAEIEFIPLAGKDEFETLVYNMKSKKVDVVIHYDSNPVYHLPKDYGYADALKNVPHVVSLTEFANESSVAGTHTLPINHYLESWGDYQIRTGILSLQQPVIEPLYSTRQKEAALLNWLSGNVSGYTHDIYHKYIMDRWQNEVYPNKNLAVDFRTFWFASLHDGVFQFKETPAASNGFNPAYAGGERKNYDKNKFAVLLTKSAAVGDGSFANNGWQQELPHPVSKVVWDNYAAISPSSAKKLNVENNDLIDVTVSGRKLSIPVILQPGMAENVISIDLGYGRWEAGEIGTQVGFYANELMTKDSGFSNWIYINASVVKGDGSYELVSTQEHHSLDEEFVKDLHIKRGIIQEGTALGYMHDSNFMEKKHEKEPLSIVPEVEYQGVKWGMAIDLNKCLGCNQCTASCNVENNIPVVGKEQVGNGREMQWIRIDR
ncbi:MAG TPA: molybdopterin oxidoreductase, partial [Ignavibacteriales bacterium]|nr:molybdopterin oxidoreductase [Ignavibacteriales bacterium]